MIDQKLIDECEKDLDSFGSLMNCQANDLLNAYISLIEQNAELHKENAKLKAFADDIGDCNCMGGVAKTFREYGL